MIPESIDADPDPKDPNIFAGSGSEFVGFGSIEPDKNLSRWRIGNVTCGWPSPISHTIQIKHTFLWTILSKYDFELFVWTVN